MGSAVQREHGHVGAATGLGQHGIRDRVLDQVVGQVVGEVVSVLEHAVQGRDGRRDHLLVGLAQLEQGHVEAATSQQAGAAPEVPRVRVHLRQGLAQSVHGPAALRIGGLGIRHRGERQGHEGRGHDLPVCHGLFEHRALLGDGLEEGLATVGTGQRQVLDGLHTHGDERTIAQQPGALVRIELAAQQLLHLVAGIREAAGAAQAHRQTAAQVAVHARRHGAVDLFDRRAQPHGCLEDAPDGLGVGIHQALLRPEQQGRQGAPGDGGQEGLDPGECFLHGARAQQRHQDRVGQERTGDATLGTRERLEVGRADGLDQELSHGRRGRIRSQATLDVAGQVPGPTGCVAARDLFFQLLVMQGVHVTTVEPRPLALGVEGEHLLNEGLELVRVESALHARAGRHGGVDEEAVEVRERAGWSAALRFMLLVGGGEQLPLLVGHVAEVVLLPRRLHITWRHQGLGTGVAAGSGRLGPIEDLEGVGGWRGQQGCALGDGLGDGRAGLARQAAAGRIEVRSGQVTDAIDHGLPGRSRGAAHHLEAECDLVRIDAPRLEQRSDAAQGNLLIERPVEPIVGDIGAVVLDAERFVDRPQQLRAAMDVQVDEQVLERAGAWGGSSAPGPGHGRRWQASRRRIAGAPPARWRPAGAGARRADARPHGCPSRPPAPRNEDMLPAPVLAGDFMGCRGQADSRCPASSSTARSRLRPCVLRVSAMSARASLGRAQQRALVSAGSGGPSWRSGRIRKKRVTVVSPRKSPPGPGPGIRETISASQPASSRTSRRAACSGVSPSSMRPLG